MIRLKTYSSPEDVGSILKELESVVEIEVKKCKSDQIEDQAEPEDGDQADQLSLFRNVTVDHFRENSG